MKRFLLLVLAIAVVACSQATAPDGVRSLTVTGLLNSYGNADVALPAEAGTIADPPSVTCYVGEPSSATLFPLNGAPVGGFGYCVLIETDGVLHVHITGSNQFYRFVIVVLYQRD